MKMKLHKVYRFQMRPTARQAHGLHCFAGARRFVYNWGLARRKEYYQQHHKSISAKQLSSELMALKKKPETVWLKEIDTQLLQQALADLHHAFKNFFEKRAGFPRFKSKKDTTQSFRIPQRVKVEAGQVYVPKIGWVRIRQSQQIDGETKSATFKRDATGKWYVTLVAEFDMPDVLLPCPNPEHVVGIDLGLKDLAVLSNGERIAAPQFYRKAERKLKRAQRELSRTQTGSKNRAKAKQRVAKLHQRIRNQRQDFLHKLTTQLVRNYHGICIEDLSLNGMAKTKLAKSVLDAGLGEFRRQLEYKTVWHRRHLAVVDRFFPSSKLCRKCGVVNDTLTLADREWTCACGAVHDRDYNAACNIKREGLKQLVAVGHTETLNACGVHVRPHTGVAVGSEASIPSL